MNVTGTSDIQRKLNRIREDEDPVEQQDAGVADVVTNVSSTHHSRKCKVEVDVQVLFEDNTSLTLEGWVKDEVSPNVYIKDINVDRNQLHKALEAFNRTQFAIKNELLNHIESCEKL